MPQTFNFPYHRISDEYPESSAIVKFGRGYEFASAPRGPDQIIFDLEFPAMFYIVTKATGLVDLTTAPTYNIMVLQKFYEDHRLYLPFDFPHPSRGIVSCRFKTPLVMPKPLWDNKVGGIPGFPNHSAHQVDTFSLKLIMQP